MDDGFFSGWLILATVPTVVLVCLVLNYPRARRWQKKADSHGKVHCRSCGHVGVLDVGSTSSHVGSSSNLHLICEKCESPNWFIPEDEKSR